MLYVERWLSADESFGNGGGGGPYERSLAMGIADRVGQSSEEGTEGGVCGGGRRKRRGWMWHLSGRLRSLRAREIDCDRCVSLECSVRLRRAVVLCFTISHWRQLRSQRASQRIGSRPGGWRDFDCWVVPGTQISVPRLTARDKMLQRDPDMQSGALRQKYMYMYPAYL